MLELTSSFSTFTADDRPGSLASAVIDEADAISKEGGLMSPSLLLAAWRGQEARASELIEATILDATARRETKAIALAEYARAVLYNGLGRYAVALAAAKRARGHEGPATSARLMTELVEAGTRSGGLSLDAVALRRLEGRTRGDGLLGIRVRSRALLSDGEVADVLYQEALARLTRSPFPLHVARAQLVYGEWLRRQSRRIDAREQLRAAHAAFSHTGAEGFAERARRELAATGETVRKRNVEARDELTAQEAQIARLASDGLTNPEIGAQLFLSPRTVEWHLHKVFAKLRISSRKQLRETLPEARKQSLIGSQSAMPIAEAAASRADLNRLAVPWSNSCGPRNWPACPPGGSSRATATHAGRRDAAA
jgi:DNA-binding CsgD family transcriptional regulator